MTGPAVILLAARQRPLAQRLAAALPGCRVHAPQAIALEGETPYGELAPHLRNLFREGIPILALCAAAIPIRILAPLLEEKEREPPVLVVDPAGRFLVPLLGGHRGANRLANALATAIGAQAVTTTASDPVLGLALDEPPPGWRLRGHEHLKAFTARLLDGESVRLLDECGCGDWLAAGSLPLAEEAANEILVTWRDTSANARRLVYRPPVLAVGVGTERNVPADSLIPLVDRTLAEAGASADAVACIASLDLKVAEPAVHALAAHLDVPARFLAREELEARAGDLATPSEAVRRAVGVAGVAEAAALAAAGPGSRLLMPKRRGERVTCALALARRPIDPASVGRARGCLHILGIGPGGSAWRSREVERALEAAEEIVGYGLYLDLLGALAEGKRLHRFALGEEEKRCRAALDLAASGRRVALVCSGDPGIYALATLVCELLDREGAARPEWQRIELAVCPGISAMQAAAARIGAPLGHDFCAVSLSDLLTPRETILRRLEAAAAGDFVLALYNPVSRRRRELLAAARDILLASRPAGTPVVIARNLGRQGERVDVVTLAELDPDGIDMLSLVIVGSSRTRQFGTIDGRPLVYTPRGYCGT